MIDMIQEVFNVPVFFDSESERLFHQDGPLNAKQLLEEFKDNGYSKDVNFVKGEYKSI